MMCGEKNRYTKSTAEKVAARNREKFGVKLRIYRCPSCGEYHLTSKTNWTKKIDKFYDKKNHKR